MKRKRMYIKGFRISSIILECLWILMVIIFFTLFYFENKAKGDSDIYLPFMLVFCILASLNIVLVVYAFEISLTEYRYENNTIGIYAGGLYHLLYINDSVVDSVKSLNSFKEISLNGKLNELLVEAKISSFSHVKLFIDGKGIPPVLGRMYDDK